MNLIFVLLCIYILYKLQGHIYEKYWKKGLTINIHFTEQEATEGEDLFLEELVRNEKFLPLPSLKVKFQTPKQLIFEDLDNTNLSDNLYRYDLLPMSMNQKLIRRLKFNCSKRGYYTLSRIDILCADIFLSFELVDYLNFHDELYVYPKYIDFNETNLNVNNILGEIIAKKNLNEDPFEFRGIRPYEPFDTIKSINWKSTAKTGDLKVNLHDYTSMQKVKIILNLESDTLWRMTDLEEESIRMAISLASTFITNGFPTSFITNGKDIITKEIVKIPSASSPNHIKTLNQSMARIDTEQSYMPFNELLKLNEAFENKSSYTIFISFSTKKSTIEYLEKELYQYEKEGFLWLLPYKEEILDDIPNNLKSYIKEYIVER